MYMYMYMYLEIEIGANVTTNIMLRRMFEVYDTTVTLGIWGHDICSKSGSYSMVLA